MNIGKILEEVTYYESHEAYLHERLFQAYKQEGFATDRKDIKSIGYKYYRGTNAIFFTMVKKDIEKGGRLL